MGTREGRPYVVAQPLTAGEAQAFVHGTNDKGFYIELIARKVRPGRVTEWA